MTCFKPLLAIDLADWNLLPHRNIMVSPKFDGFRCIIMNGVAMSRNLKPIPNKFIQAMLKNVPDGLDGELIVGSPTEGNVFNRTSSGVTAVDGEPDFKYYVFDRVPMVGPQNTPFCVRYAGLETLDLDRSPHMRVVTHFPCSNDIAFRKYHSDFTSAGFEGTMLRDIKGIYKLGRSTLRSGPLWKHKDFIDGEVRVLRVLEGRINLNPAETNELGETQRASLKENYVPNGMVGTIVGEDLKTGAVVDISPGKMTHKDRAYYWSYQDRIIGKVVKYKAQSLNELGIPRFPTFQGFRSQGDM